MLCGNSTKDLEQINTLIPNVLAYMNLGGTAIGTGITTEYSYRELAIQALGKISGKKIKSAPDLIKPLLIWVTLFFYLVY